MKKRAFQEYQETLGKVSVVMILLSVAIPFISRRYGAHPWTMIWAAWIQVFIYTMALAQAGASIRAVKRRLSAGRGVVDWSGPPYRALFKHSLSTVLALLVMFLYTFGFFGFFEYEKQATMLWLWFGAWTIFGLVNFSQTGLRAVQVIRIMDDADAQLV